MIVDNNKHYLYRHIRLDKNEPFYIGIGTMLDCDINIKKYRRATAKNGRNSIWKSIVRKSIYEVEIMIESDDYSFIKQKEKEFIELYGRKNIGTGILANMTDGGEGKKGYIPNEETKKKMSESHKRKSPRSEEHKRRLSEALKGKKRSDEMRRKCSERQKGRIGPMTGRKFTPEHIKRLSDSHKRKSSKSVIQYDMEDNVIKKWQSIGDACENIGVSRNTLIKYINTGISNAMEKNRNKYRYVIK